MKQTKDETDAVQELLKTGWSKLNAKRREMLERYPSNWRLPVRKRHKELALEVVQPGERVLEIGASNSSLKPFLCAQRQNLVYKTMDIDRHTQQDYYSLDEISDTFDAVLLFEVIEHVPAEEAADLIARIRDLLRPGGHCIMSTPNLFHPHRYWDIHHYTPWRYDWLGGMLEALGMEVDGVYRLYNAPFVQRCIRLWLLAPLHRYIDVDFAKSICIVARRPDGSDQVERATE